MIWIEFLEGFEGGCAEMQTGSGGQSDAGSFHQGRHVPQGALT